MRYEIILPKNFDASSLHDYRVCWLSERPVYLKLYHYKLHNEFYVRLIFQSDEYSLYKGTFFRVSRVLELVKEGLIKLVPLTSDEVSQKRKKITLKQKLFLVKLMNELKLNIPIPEDRYEASKLISRLLKMRKQKMSRV